MKPGPSVEIVLEKPELLVRGTLSEATPEILNGKLLVHLPEQMRVRSLRLSFTGRIDFYYSQGVVGSSPFKDVHQEIMAHEWEFLEPQRPAIFWGPGDKAFEFSFMLPGDSPETLSTALGKICYQLQATLERPSFHSNLVDTVDIPVKRGPVAGAPWALALMESIEATGEWDQQLDYRVSVPTRSLKDGEVFQTRFEVMPRAKGIKLVAVGVLVKEYVKYYTPQGQSVHKTARVVARNENYLDSMGICTTQARSPDSCLDLIDATSVHIPLSVPDAYSGIQYDVLHELIEIRHRIKFLIKIRDPFMLVHSIFVAVPVSIMPVTARDDSSLLPRYEVAVATPGSLLMRSGTQPPPYDDSAGDVCVASPASRLLRQQATSPLKPASARGSGMAEAAHQASLGAAPHRTGASPCLHVVPATEINGFPCPICRSGSQFYLASPDASPSSSPRSSVLVDAPGRSALPREDRPAPPCPPPPLADANSKDKTADLLPCGEQARLAGRAPRLPAPAIPPQMRRRTTRSMSDATPLPRFVGGAPASASNGDCSPGSDPSQPPPPSSATPAASGPASLHASAPPSRRGSQAGLVGFVLPLGGDSSTAAPARNSATASRPNKKFTARVKGIFHSRRASGASPPGSPRSHSRSSSSTDRLRISTPSQAHVASNRHGGPSTLSLLGPFGQMGIVPAAGVCTVSNRPNQNAM